MKFVYFLTFFILLFTACQENKATTSNEVAELPKVKVLETPKSQFVRQLEKAHHVSDFQEKYALAFDIKLIWGGKPSLDATITSTTNSTKVRLDKADNTTNTTAIYDGEKVYFAPDSIDAGGARFSIFTWQYFVMAPFKFSDPGTNWQMLGMRNLEPDQPLDAAKLTFGDGVGDAPDDWYIAFKSPNTNLTEGMAYIVTGGTRTQEEAEQKISAVTYHDYQEVDGIPIPMKMKFWYYDMKIGLQDQKGEAEVSNVRFLTSAEADFAVPENSKLLE
ncbi:MAG: hypothetical protein AB8G22_05230 [Saprospiraceae bacterium]